MLRPPSATDRLAELVAHLAECSAEVALAAVAHSLAESHHAGAAAQADDVDERLTVIARALLLVHHDRQLPGPA
jgi:hypothetical protein